MDSQKKWQMSLSIFNDKEYLKEILGDLYVGIMLMTFMSGKCHSLLGYIEKLNLKVKVSPMYDMYAGKGTLVLGNQLCEVGWPLLSPQCSNLVHICSWWAVSELQNSSLRYALRCF